MSYESTIVKKPWGYEYMVYENEDASVWFLYIAPGQSTSMHCHPKKTTGLVLLDGEAEVSFLADKRDMKALDKVMIRRGLYHSTKAVSDKGAFIFEIENPVDKHDLVRLSDKYGRASKAYEDSTHEIPKAEDCLWIEEPKIGENITYNFADCNLKVETINDVEIINNKSDDDLIMFLKGGLIKNIDNTFHCVTIPGDVGFGRIVKQVSTKLDGVQPGTIIMTITK
jgi:mannose-6-phosphate isomerase-like protein (cupin superfamily)